MRPGNGQASFCFGGVRGNLPAHAGELKRKPPMPDRSYLIDNLHVIPTIPNREGGGPCELGSSDKYFPEGP